MAKKKIAKAKPAKTKPKAKAKPAMKKATAKPASKGKHKSWLDDKTKSSLIDDYAMRMESLVKAIADGRVDDDELESQEKRLTDCMKAVEPMLNDAQHAKVTQLLCEMAVYDMMQTLHGVQSSRTAARFVG